MCGRPHSSSRAYELNGGFRLDVLSTPTWVSQVELAEPSLAELARVIKSGVCIEASFKRGKGEAGMDAYQVRTVRRESTVEECGNTIGYTGIR